MKKVKFQKLINQCEIKLKEEGLIFYDHENLYRLGVCGTLLITIGPKPLHEFSSLFSPEDSEGFWIGSIKVLDDPNNEILELRILFLRMFEAYCVEFGLYKKF